MDVLVLGGGAREHAIAWRLASDESVSRVSIAPGNAGTAAVGRNLPDLQLLDPDAVARHAARERYGLVVVGPEAPLAAGVADALERARIPVVGPVREAARLESSKEYAKRVMHRVGVATARADVFADRESALRHARAAAANGTRLVVKADWLAAGKGVVVPETHDEAEAAIRDLFASPAGLAGGRVLLEERLVGREVSVMALVSGEHVVPLLPARDYKRRDDGDRGPNTGGMGAFAPVPWFADRDVERAVAEIVEPVAWRMARDGVVYRGVLYAGLMLTDDGPRVLEFNVRLGDPEAQVLMPLIDGDLGAALVGCALGEAGEMERNLSWRSDAAVAVVVASEGYPGDPAVGRALSGAEPAGPGDARAGTALCFHGATRRRADGGFESAGGRVVTFVGVGTDHAQARDAAYAAARGAALEGAHHRGDVALDTGAAMGGDAEREADPGSLAAPVAAS